METEIWRPILGFEGYYEVSNLGRVRSLPRDVECSGKISGQVHHQQGAVLSPIRTYKTCCHYMLRKSGTCTYVNPKKLLKIYFPEVEVNVNTLFIKKDENTMVDVKDEIWKPIEGFEGYYEVSNTGKVRSVERTIQLEGKRSGQVRTYSSRELKPLLVAGHTIVKLYKDRTYQSVGVGRLVALHFLEGFKESGRSKIRYKDGDITNCSVDNLE